MSMETIWKAARPLAVLAAALVLASCEGGSGPQLASTEQPIIYNLQPCPPGFNAFALPPGAGGIAAFLPLTSLAAVANPVLPKDPKTGAYLLRPDLAPYVANLPAAIQLGKALFWDIQAGSDGTVSCATCHFQAGADVRTRNQLSPGFNKAFDGLGVNISLAAGDFPFTDPVFGKNVDNIAGSQGVRNAVFGGVSATGVETTTLVAHPVYGDARQVTDDNAPPVINAVFNHRNFFNARAQNDFNGVTPFGIRDPNARVYQADAAGNITQVQIGVSPTAPAIVNASLASQAVGPPLNTTEMSASGRTFPELGKKMLALKPLGLQKVDSTDSVLGKLAEPAKLKGLHTTYGAMIQAAFQPAWWNSAQTVTIGTGAYTLMQANFSLYWGLSIMLYEATLVSDQTPMDQYVASRTLDATGTVLTHNPALLDPVVARLAAEFPAGAIPLATGGARAVTRQDILTGLDLFEKPIPPQNVTGLPAGSGVGCILCHVGAETTAASVRNLTVGVDPLDAALHLEGTDLRMERMFMGFRPPAIPSLPTPQPPPPVPFGTTRVTYDIETYATTVTEIAGAPVTPVRAPVNVYDVGWYDIGVRPPNEDHGVGGTLPTDGLPLSWVEFFQTTMAPAQLNKVIVPGGGLTCIDANGNPIVPPAAAIQSPFAGEVVSPADSLPILTGPLLGNLSPTGPEKTDVDASFKTLSLRNVELNGPYFHTGGKATLSQVVELYDMGGDFGGTTFPINPTLSPLIRPLGLTPDQHAALVAFLVSMTDDRVLYQRAPFDHPELPVPAGQDATGRDIVTLMPPVGAKGSTTPVKRFLSLNPFQP